MNIERTLFWFQDGDEKLITLNEGFFGLGTLLNRLLNEKYDGKKIKFINIDFSTNQTYELHPILPKESPYYFGGHLRYYGTFNKEEFLRLNREAQNKFLWDKSYYYLTECAKSIKNDNLLKVADYAYFKGLEINFNTDYKVVDTPIVIHGERLQAAIWIKFKEDAVYSIFTLEKGGEVIFEKSLDKTKNGVEFFIDMYKAIVLEGNNIVIKGLKDSTNFLPFRISSNEI